MDRCARYLIRLSNVMVILDFQIEYYGNQNSWFSGLHNSGMWSLPSLEIYFGFGCQTRQSVSVVVEMSRRVEAKRSSHFAVSYFVYNSA
jgi:hypothetical protein